MKRCRLDEARIAWGADLPDFVEALARQVDKTSQAKTAQLLERAPSWVSTILSNTYGAGLDRAEERVRGVLMDHKIVCPALGEITTHLCQDWRDKSRAYQSTNRQRVLMFRACRSCPHFQKDEGGSDG